MESKRVIVPDIAGLPSKAAALIGRVLRLDDLDAMPTANDFRDPMAVAETDASIAANRDIVFTSVKMVTERWDWRFHFLWHGRGLDGRVMLLIVDDVFPTMYVQCPADAAPSSFMDAIRVDLANLKLATAGKFEVVMRRRLVYFEVDPRPYVRVMFTQYENFVKAAAHFRDVRKWIVADTDYAKSRFYLQAVRANNIAPAGMNVFSFKQRGNPYPQHIDSAFGDVFVVSMANIQPYQPRPNEMREAYLFPRLTEMCFDIETGSAERGKALDANRDDTHSHVLSFTLRYNRRDLLRVSLTTSPWVVPKTGFIQFVCGSEEEMFMMWAHMVRKLRPAKIITYNGDNFDWRFIVTKLVKSRMVEAFFATIDFIIADLSWIKETGINRALRVARRYMRDTTVKISAEEMRCPVYFPDMGSFINMDMFTLCRRKWPRSKFSEKSLNAFLTLVGEPLKFDMPAWRQFDIYEAKLVFDRAAAEGRLDQNATDFLAHVADITDVNVYCVFDTIATLDLMDRANVWLDTIITAQHTLCTPYEAITLAKGGLVIEKFVTSAFRAGYLDCNEPSMPANGKYPGALVLHPPKRGLTTITPRVDELRHMDARWAAVSDAEEKIMRDAFLNKWAAPLEWPPVAGLTARSRELFAELVAMPKGAPCVDYDFKSMYPTIMAEHNASTERMVKSREEEAELLARGYKLYIKDRVIDGRNIHTSFVREEGGPEKRGLIPREQQEFRMKRAAINKELKEARARLAKMTKPAHDDERDSYAYNVAEALVARLDAEQLECKVCMNTYYGKMGDQTNKFYRLEIASDVTLTGREYLMEVIAILRDHGWTEVMYGDTDSVYVRPPASVFGDIHSQWFGGVIGRIEYATQMVNRAIAVAKDMGTTINARLRATGSDFMEMEMEGAHFPYLFIRPKRNATGIHKTAAAFDDLGNPKETHMTGVADKKGKSASKLFITMSMNVLGPLLNVLNTRDVEQITRASIGQAYEKIKSGEWPMDMFIKRGQLKPEKHNVAIINFCARLKREGRTPPQPYEKFPYVYVRRDSVEFNASGCDAHASAADYMELPEYAMEKKMVINVGKYMTSEICSELGQYMCCSDKYRIEAKTEDDDAMKAAEEATQSLGRDFVERLCDEVGDVLPMAVRKPAYVSIKKGVDGYVARKLKPIGLDQRRLKAITKLAEGGAFDVMMSQIAAEATKRSAAIVDGMRATYGAELENPSAVVKLHTRMRGECSPKAVFDRANGARREELHTELRAIATQIDSFVTWLNEYNARLSQVARAMVGLDKPIISLEDVNEATRLIAGGALQELDVAVPATIVVPTNNVLARRDAIVDELIAIDRQAIAFDTFSDIVLTKIEQAGRIGQAVSREQIADDIESAGGIDLPAEVYEV